MANYELDDILYWKDYESFQKMIEELNKKYDKGYNSIQYNSWYDELNAYYRKTIPDKKEFIRRFKEYELYAKPNLIEGNNQNILSQENILDCFRNVSKENDIFHVRMLEIALQGWAAQHLSHYAEKICFTTSKEHKILEIMVGDGTGTSSIVRSLKDDMYYIGVDIDLLCAKNADDIGRYYGKNAIGICSNLYDLPFSDNLFDVVCSHFGFDECREIPTILKEAVRVLKPGGRFVSVSKDNLWLRSYYIFKKYDIDKSEALELMRKVRLYTDFEHFDSLAVEAGLMKVDYIPFGNCYLVEYVKGK